MHRMTTPLNRPLFTTLLFAALLSGFAMPAMGKAKQVGPHHWTGVERIVAIGDLHGDWDQYMSVMQSAGLVDRRGKWAGGDTHLVQTGDIPDRGPDTRRIIDHLAKLKKEAARKGGHVHTLIGNHEAMNVYGDLRYVTPGEFAAFETRSSQRYQDALWEQYLARFQARDPEAFAALDVDAHRQEWVKSYPLGWNEHRLAWSSGGEYGDWVLNNPVVLKVNDTLFLHGGLSAKFCALSLEEITDAVHAVLQDFDPMTETMVDDPLGPLWYRGLATDDEALRGDMLGAILERYDARRIVVGHTPTQGIVWPRFDGRVVLNDTGIAAHYGGYNAFLDIAPDGLQGVHNGQAVALPADNAGRMDYLRAVIAINPGNPYLQSRLQKMQKAQQRDRQGAPESPPAPEPAPEAMTEEQRQAAAEAAQIEAWLSPDNCR